MSSSMDKKGKRVVAIEESSVKIPNWTGEACRSDPKWLGKCLWPLEIDCGKGRADVCLCEYPGSIDCVRSHIAENRRKLKLELGAQGFHLCGFAHMGEEVVSLEWTDDEKNRFEGLITDGRNLMKLRKCFPDKTMRDLVRYYFNVFVNQKRAYENRQNGGEIDSDNDAFTPT